MKCTRHSLLYVLLIALLCLTGEVHAQAGVARHDGDNGQIAPHVAWPRELAAPGIGLGVVLLADKGLSSCVKGPYRGGIKPGPELRDLLKKHAEWAIDVHYYRAKYDDPRFANLCGANLSGLDLREVNLEMVSLSGADLVGADLSKANLISADLSGAELSHANLSGAWLVYANLRGASLDGASLDGANLNGANLEGTVFSLRPGAVPSAENIAYAKNLDKITYAGDSHALVELQEALKKAGFREEERQVTYARKRHEAANANWAERWFNFVLFDLTSQYGMSPGRPLRILFSLIPIFAFAYMIALSASNGGGIWIVWSDDRVLKNEGQDEPTRISCKGFRLIRIGLQFSLLSTFNIGWHDLNIGNWIARIQAHEYELRGTGWVRMVAGVQSLIGVYLLALWALTYFGRPFE